MEFVFMKRTGAILFLFSVIFFMPHHAHAVIKCTVQPENIYISKVQAKQEKFRTKIKVQIIDNSSQKKALQVPKEVSWQLLVQNKFNNKNWFALSRDQSAASLASLASFAQSLLTQTNQQLVLIYDDGVLRKSNLKKEEFCRQDKRLLDAPLPITIGVEIIKK